MSKKLIELENINVTIADNNILKGIDFVLHEGEHTCICGSNGAGKSTLFKLLRGEINHNYVGQISWFFKDSVEHSGLMGQKMTALVSTSQLENYISKAWRITVRDLILTGIKDTLLFYDSPSEEDVERANKIAEEFNLSHLLDKLVPILSLGQLRLALLARACIRKPEILLLDEFTDGLDKKTRAHINEVLEKIAKTTTLVAIAHRIETLPTCIAREVNLEQGKIVKDTKRTVWQIDYEPSAINLNESFTATDKILIDIYNADVYLDGTKILHGINLTIKQGEHWAIVGDNGAGKSTLLRLIAGFENVALGGHIHRYLPRQGDGIIVEMAKMRHGIGLVSDKLQAEYWYNISAEDLVLSGFERSVGIFHNVITEEQRQIAKAWQQRLGIEEFAKRDIRSLSTGQLRKFFLARAMVANPDILLLDEPCSGLDAKARNEFLEIIQSLSQSGVTIIFVTHHESDLIPAISHIAHIKEGRLSF